MTMLDATAVLLQIVLPVAALSWLGLAPSASRVGFVVQAAAVGFVVSALAFVMVWLAPPLWVACAYLVGWAAICLVYLLRRRASFVSLWPQTASAWGLFAFSLVLGGYGAVLVGKSVSGWTPPADAAVIDLPLPLGPGTYQVANGGAHKIINAHLMTLTPQTPRQRDYRGQSYGVDLVKTGVWRARADGWRPADPSRYAIFGEPVFAPCDGLVVSAVSDMVDMPVPQPDRTRLEGNHVFIKCGGFGVLLAHLRQGSVAVVAGDSVKRGAQVGEVGNSGQTFEPHLHIHVQEIADAGAIFAAAPLHLTLDGVFPRRNSWLRGSDPD